MGRELPGWDTSQADIDISIKSVYIVITQWRLGYMKAKLVQIGNSRGVRLPKPLIEEAKLKDEVDINVREGAIVITSIGKPRSGWAESAKLMHNRQGDKLIDPISETQFDQTEWQW